MAALLQNKQFQALRGVTNTAGESVTTTIEVANNQIITLENEVGSLKKELAVTTSREWQKPNDTEMDALVEKLRALGIHSVTLASHLNTDCAEFTYNLEFAFTKAGWTAEVLNGLTYAASVTRGIFVSGHVKNELAFEVCSIIAKQLRVTEIVGLQDREDTDPIEVRITVGPKFPPYDKARSALTLKYPESDSDKT